MSIWGGWGQLCQHNFGHFAESWDGKKTALDISMWENKFVAAQWVELMLLQVLA